MPSDQGRVIKSATIKADNGEWQPLVKNVGFSADS